MAPWHRFASTIIFFAGLLLGPFLSTPSSSPQIFFNLSLGNEYSFAGGPIYTPFLVVFFNINAPAPITQLCSITTLSLMVAFTPRKQYGSIVTLPDTTTCEAKKQ